MYGYDHFGSSAVPIGDTNGDGITDFVVGATGDDSQLNYFTSYVHVISGSNGAVLRTLFSGSPSPIRFGAAVAAMGDVNGDSIPDFVIGSPWDLNRRGTVGLVYGTNAAVPPGGTSSSYLLIGNSTVVIY